MVKLGSGSQSVEHDDGSQVTRLSTRWTGLNPGQVYRIVVQCKIQGEDCPGVSPTFNASTACSGM